jgi:hypothetical protein
VRGEPEFWRAFLDRVRGGLDGGLYFPWDADEQVASKVLELAAVVTFRGGDANLSLARDQVALRELTPAPKL